MHGSQITVLRRHQRSSDLKPTEHLCDAVEEEIHVVDVQSANLQQLCDHIFSEECFQHLWSLCQKELRQF